MVYPKRLLSCTGLGLVAGVFCWQGGQSIGVAYTPALVAATVLNRGFIGLAIGISALRLHYFAHGALIGALGSLPIAMMAGNFGYASMLTVYGALWGLLIEVLATRVLRAPMQ